MSPISDIQQGHTVRVEQIDDKWLCRYLTCTYKQESDSKEQAYKDMGYHFGRISTQIHSYGSFTYEILDRSKL